MIRTRFSFLGSWEFWRAMIVLLLACVILPTMLVGCSISQVQTDISKLLALLPSISGIVQSVLAILAAAGAKTSAAGTVIANAITDVGTLAKDIQGVITTYQSNIAAMPATTLNQVDAWVAALQSELTTIQAQFPQISATLAAAISAGFISVEAILGYLAAILPTGTAKMYLPRSYNRLTAAGIKFGSEATVVIPTPRTFAKNYNAKVAAAGYGKYGIHVPWVHVAHIPIWP